MPSFQRHELLVKKEFATSAEEAKNRTYQEANGVYHARVLFHLACGRQGCTLLNAQADRVLANDKVPACWTSTTRF